MAPFRDAAPELRVLLVLHAPLAESVGHCLSGPETQVPRKVWPGLPGYVVQHATQPGEALTMCDALGARVVVGGAGAHTSSVFHWLHHERPAVGRLLLISDLDVRVALQKVNDCPAHYVLFGSLDEPPAKDELVRSLAALETFLHVTPGAATPRSHSPQSLGRRKQLSLLSDREREILWHLVKGARTADIAEKLYVSEHTVRNHIKAMFRKLDVHSQSALVAFARSR